ncbi:MAG: NAD(P)-dependent dehydrogenase (short-subunit alcohol dehydrogenase family) [Cryomorphaceae bacterium]|jgi:NAD(P)-dependent dehydrogenase (short-subunit alcohol dehydrogenase family)
MSYIDKLYDLEGKVAVVIGGTGELCSHMAIGLAKAGVQVVLAGRNEDKAEDRLDAIHASSDECGAGEKAYFVATDLMEKGSLYALLDIVIERSGKVDILINGAGVKPSRSVFELKTEEFQTILDINLTSTFQACQVFGQYFLEHAIPASIINLGSVAGLTPLSNSFAYSASKAALHNLTKNLAREWADSDIRVNTLIPGFFPSDQNRRALDEARMLDILRRTPMSRFGSPDELIGATLLLASAKAGSFITGSELIVDGGFNTVSI